VIGVDATSFLVIVATAAIASLAVTVLGPRVAPVVGGGVVALGSIYCSVGSWPG
jgi:hypothetical protein